MRRRTGFARAARLALVVLPSLLALAQTACTLKPTPYQPLGEAGGYEETRLGERIYRVSFRGNRATPETEVLDYLFLRCAELTKAAGYTHFEIQKDFGNTQYAAVPSAPRASTGVMVLGSGKRSFWSLQMTAPLGEPDYDVVVSYHVAIFVIRMLTPEEAKAAGDKAYDAAYMIRSLQAKRAAGQRHAE